MKIKQVTIMKHETKSERVSKKLPYSKVNLYNVLPNLSKKMIAMLNLKQAYKYMIEQPVHSIKEFHNECKEFCLDSYFRR